MGSAVSGGAAATRTPQAVGQEAADMEGASEIPDVVEKAPLEAGGGEPPAFCRAGGEPVR